MMIRKLSRKVHCLNAEIRPGFPECDWTGRLIGAAVTFKFGMTLVVCPKCGCDVVSDIPKFKGGLKQ